MSLSPLDWGAHSSTLLLNPRIPKATQERAHHEFSRLVGDAGVVGVATSGSTTTDELKVALLSREAFLCAARAAVEFLQLGSRDIWLHVLPDFHVGGLAIWARAHICGMRVVKVEGAWQAANFFRAVEQTAASWCSLVPTQVFDLVQSRCRAPSSLRGVLVGGGMLPPSLYRAGRDLGWPLLPSYGMTECCSQVATAPTSSLMHLESPRLKLLPHVQVRTNPDGALEIFSPALLSGYLVIGSSGTHKVDPRHGGWFTTDDLGEVVDGQWLTFLGRRDDQVKVLGELVSLSRLQARVDQELPVGDFGRAVVLALPDERLGHRLICAIESRASSSHGLSDELRRVNHQVLPFERILEIRRVPQFPRNELGKILRAQLLELVRQIAAEPL